MPPMRLCSRDSSMRSVSECRAAGAGGIYPEPLELGVAAGAAGLQPDLVETQDVAVGLRARALAHLVQRLDHGLELLGQLREHRGKHASAAARARLREGPVSAAAHGDVVVDVDELGGEAVSKEAGDEQRYVAKTLQVTQPLGGARPRLQRLAQHG